MSKNTKLFVLMIILISLISISAVSAEEIDTDIISDDNCNKNIVSITNTTQSQYSNNEGIITNEHTHRLMGTISQNILKAPGDNVVEVTNDNVDTFTSTLTDGNVVIFNEDINGKTFSIDKSVTFTSANGVTLTNCFFEFDTGSCTLENLTLKYTSTGKVFKNSNDNFAFTMKNCVLTAQNPSGSLTIIGTDAFETEYNSVILKDNVFNFNTEHSITMFDNAFENEIYGIMAANFEITGNNLTANCDNFYGFVMDCWIESNGDTISAEFSNNNIEVHGENVKVLGLVDMEDMTVNANIHDNSIYMECSYGDLDGFSSDLTIYHDVPLGFFAHQTPSDGDVKFNNNNLTLYVNGHDPRRHGNRPNSYNIILLGSNIELYDNNILCDASETGFTGTNDFVYSYIMTTNGCNGLKVHDNNFTGKGTYCVHGVQSLGDKNGEYYNNVFDIDTISTSYQFYSDGGSSGLNIHNNNFTGKSEVPYGISLTDQTTNFQFKDNNIYLEGNYSMGYATYGSKGNTITGNNITCIGIGSEDPYYSWDLLGAETVGIRLMGTTTGYTITDNRIITNQDYAIDLKSHDSYAKSKSNTITDNILIAKELDGDEAVNEAEDNTVHDNLGKITPVLTVKDFTTETNKKVTVSVTVLDEDGENVDGGNVTVNLGGKDYIGTVNNGIAKVSVKAPAGAGTYTLTATYAPENLVYNTAETTATVKVKEPVIELIDTVTSITPSTGEVNSTIDVAINVVDVNGGNVNSGSVKVEFNGKTETITLTNGVATYNTVLPDTSGEYNLIATFVGDNTYKTSSTNEIITVTEKNNTNSSGDNETNVTLVDTSLSMKFDGINQILTGNLADVNNNPIKANVDISLTTLSTGDVKTYTVSSDDTGKFSLNLNLAAGDYSAKSTYAGDNKYASSSSDKVLISISNTPSNVILADEDEVTGVYGEDNEFNGVLTDKDGNALSGYHIALNLTRLSSGASKIYWVTTDYNGNYVLPINLAPGVYTVRTSIDDKNFTGSSLSSLIIEDPNSNTSDDNRTVTVLNTPNLNLVNGVGGVFEGLLLDNLGYGVAGQHVDLKLSNVHGQYKVYSVTTDYEGKFSLPINLGLGTYTVESIYNGTGDYQGTSNIKTIKVE